MSELKQSQDAVTEEESSSDTILDALIKSSNDTKTSPKPSNSTGILLGEIVDTHHPDIPGRLFIRWNDEHGKTQQRWLMYSIANGIQIGKKVLLAKPDNWGEWLVVSILAAAHALPDNVEEKEVEHKADNNITLKEAETIKVETESGNSLLDITHYENGAVLRLGKDITFEFDGTFRIDAERIELNSKQGGTDLRSDGEMVYRSPRIRLN